MPGRRPDREWDNRIFELTQQNPKMGPGPLRNRLKQQAGSENDLPSERTIARRQEYFRDQNPEWRRQFDFFRFPESIQGDPDLPPEASRSAFELWHHLEKRPTVRICRAFYLATCALGSEVARLFGPDLDLFYRFGIALQLVAAEDNPAELRRIDDAIMRQDWGQFPVASAPLLPDDDDQTYVAKIEALMGQLPEQTREWLVRWRTR